MSADVVIRPARESDREALIEQFQGLNRHEDLIVRNRRVDRMAGEESLDAADAKIAKTNGLRLVAELGGKVVGHLDLTFETGPVFIHADLREYAYVAELFLREEARGAGTGQALLQEAERIAKARGYRRMMIGVITGNTSAERAYERFGFKPYATDLQKMIG